MNTGKLFLMSAVLGLTCSLGCSGQKETRLEEALILYRQNQLEQALPMLERVASAEGDNAEAQAWLAETYRRLGHKEDAVTCARKALLLEPCSSFAHTVLADALNPVTGQWSQADPESTWTHLMAAIRCDSTDGNAWMSVWVEAIHHGYPKLVREASVHLAQTGFLSPAALAYGRWMLRGLPENAILITNGDMDTYPPCAVQEAEGFRRDVTVVNRSLLNTMWYARYLRDQAGVSLPIDNDSLDRLAPTRSAGGELVLPSDQIIGAWMAQQVQGTLARPVMFAVTVDTVHARLEGTKRYAGAFLYLRPGTVAETADTVALRRSLSGTQPDDFAPPWVSDLDRSPVRRTTAWMLSRNVVRAALTLSDADLDAGRREEAKSWLGWARSLAEANGCAADFQQEIARLEERFAREGGR